MSETARLRELIREFKRKRRGARSMAHAFKYKRKIKKLEQRLIAEQQKQQEVKS